MTTKHTPGPWLHRDGCIEPHDKSITIATVNYGLSATLRSQYPANCALIAAAPELLEALREILAYVAGDKALVDEGDLRHIETIAFKAIEKATSNA